MKKKVQAALKILRKHMLVCAMTSGRKSCEGCIATENCWRVDVEKLLTESLEEK